MPTYVMLVKWTDQGAQSPKETLARARQNRTAAEGAGVRIIGVWWTQGAYDAVLVGEFADDETASAASLRLSMQGNVRAETMRAYTAEEMQRILDKIP
jgi:uncharacterized protein with GYD domain